MYGKSKRKGDIIIIMSGLAFMIAAIIVTLFFMEPEPEPTQSSTIEGGTEESVIRLDSDIALITTNQTLMNQQNLSDDITQLQQEIIKLRNQLEPRNISQAFLPGQTHSVNQSENPYQEATEGTIAGLPPKNNSNR